VLLWTWSTTRPSSVLALSCADSVGQQGQHGETVVGGVEGLVIPGSADPASLSPLVVDGKEFLAYKTFLAVSASDAPYATVSIVSPRSARLYYGAIVARQLRFPVCGPRFSGYPGGVLLDAPSHVTFEVTAPNRMSARVEIAVGTD
jgi:hypothetical protein